MLCTSGREIPGLTKGEPCGRKCVTSLDPKTGKPVYLCPRCDAAPPPKDA